MATLTPPANDGPASPGLAGLAFSLSHLRLVPYLTNVQVGTAPTLAPSLRFTVVERAIREGTVVKVGRHTERSARHRPAVLGMPDDILFKSKVVSRAHAEIWVDDGKFFIRDTASSSGTFLDQVRLSPQGSRSNAHRLHDGDCLQLGVEYRGGEEEMYRCVRMRVEINRRSQAAQPHANQDMVPSSPVVASNLPVVPVTTDCCICLQPLRRTPLFLTPCAHAFHYACIRPLLTTRRSRNGRTVLDAVDGFSCPMCRSYIDLNAEPADEDDDV
ncbi:SMAD/FHA domain-containing protein, partial [Thamnocephalis sphaerospora]